MGNGSVIGRLGWRWRRRVEPRHLSQDARQAREHAGGAFGFALGLAGGRNRLDHRQLLINRFLQAFDNGDAVGVPRIGAEDFVGRLGWLRPFRTMAGLRVVVALLPSPFLEALAQCRARDSHRGSHVLQWHQRLLVEKASLGHLLGGDDQSFRRHDDLAARSGDENHVNRRRAG